MTIALVVPNLTGRSGYSRYAVDLGKALVAKGHRIVAIVHEASDASWCTEYPILAMDPHYLKNPLRCFVSGLRVQSILKKENVDVIHFIAEPYALMLPFLKMKRSVMTIHGSYAVIPLATGGFTRTLATKAFHKLDRIISVSNFTKKFLITREPEVAASAKLSEKITVIPNSVDLSRAGSKKPQTDALSIISVGAVKERKGYIQAVEAIAAFKKNTGKNLQYQIFGPIWHDKAYVEKLRNRIRELSLEQTVTLCGEVSDEELRDAYAGADLFLLLSKQSELFFEGFGLVFLEANSWGIPVIGPNTGGCPEAIKEGSSGYVCDPLDTATVAKRMEDILLRGAIKPEQCKAWAADHATEKMVVEVLKAYA